MKYLLCIAFLVPACGTTPAQRDHVYAMTAMLAGKPELVPVIYAARKAVTAPKQPLDIQP